jgi:hypothetical protein
VLVLLLLLLLCLFLFLFSLWNTHMEHTHGSSNLRLAIRGGPARRPPGLFAARIQCRDFTALARQKWRFVRAPLTAMRFEKAPVGAAVESCASDVEDAKPTIIGARAVAKLSVGCELGDLLRVIAVFTECNGSPVCADVAYAADPAFESDKTVLADSDAFAIFAA